MKTSLTNNKTRTNSYIDSQQKRNKGVEFRKHINANKFTPSQSVLVQYLINGLHGLDQANNIRTNKS